MKFQVFSQTQAFKNVLRNYQKNFSTTTNLWRKSQEPIDPGPKIIVPGNCRKFVPPVSTPQCRVAVVIGGSNNGFGFVAAEQLLRHGAKRVLLADGNESGGAYSVDKLCKAYGKGRARFYPCDIKSSCQIEGIFTSSCCRNESVSVVFNDLDSIHLFPDCRYNYCAGGRKISNTRRVSSIALEYLARKRQKHIDQGIVINCASILGFMGWPAKPSPVYCLPEPCIEVTRELAKEQRDGVRLVSLCPANRSFDTIGLPDLPDDEDRAAGHGGQDCQPRVCRPDLYRDKGRLGQAILDVMARAKTGSTWLLEPSHTLRVEPRLVTFPADDAKDAQLARDHHQQECPASLYANKPKSVANGAKCNCV